jgi:hypothetical protein
MPSWYEACPRSARCCIRAACRRCRNPIPEIPKPLADTPERSAAKCQKNRLLVLSTVYGEIDASVSVFLNTRRW